jgi:regulator of sigma E protease
MKFSGKTSSVRTWLKRRQFWSRSIVWSLTLPAMLLAFITPEALDSTRRMVLMLVGFSSLIFVHELGHFVVARMCSVRCDIFSIGIGPRMLGWRRGRGVTFGKDAPVPPEAFMIDPLDPERPPAIGETDYRLSWFPLGGYVKMLGQDDMDPSALSIEERAFNNRPTIQKLAITSAGVVMNVLLAVPLFALCFTLGVAFPPAMIGDVEYGSPAFKAGLVPGDNIAAVNNHTPRYGFLEFGDIILGSAMAKRGQPVQFTVKRKGEPVTLQAIPKMDERLGLQRVGLMPALTLQISVSPKVVPALKAMGLDEAFKPGDTIRQVDGQSIRFLHTLRQEISDGFGKPIKLAIDNPTLHQIQQTREITLKPRLTPRSGASEYFVPSIVGMQPRGRVVMVNPGSPAEKAGLQRGDIITRIGSVTNPPSKTIIETIRVNHNEPVEIEVQRGTERITVKPTPVKASGGDHAVIGMVFSIDSDNPIIAGVDPDSEAAKQGLVGGMRIDAIRGQPINSWDDVMRYLSDAIVGNLPLTVTGPDGTKRVDILLAGPALQQLDMYRYDIEGLGEVVEPLTTPQQGGDLAEAIYMGFDHTYKWATQTYLTLRGLFIGTVKPSTIHGPVGIFKFGHDIQDRGTTYLIFLLGAISVNLAVMNFLPLPILDGGMVILILIEAMRGKPLPERALNIIQTVGMVLLFSLLIFATWNDIPLFFK